MTPIVIKGKKMICGTGNHQYEKYSWICAACGKEWNTRENASLCGKNKHADRQGDRYSLKTHDLKDRHLISKLSKPAILLIYRNEFILNHLKKSWTVKKLRDTLLERSKPSSIIQDCQIAVNGYGISLYNYVEDPIIKNYPNMDAFKVLDDGKNNILTYHRDMVSKTHVSFIFHSEKKMKGYQWVNY